MTDNNVLKLNTPDHPLQEILREGARKMLASAIEAEVYVVKANWTKRWSN